MRLVGTLSLLVFRPSLTALIWSTLERSRFPNAKAVHRPAMRLGTFQSGAGLANSPALITAVLYAWASRSATPHIIFVVVVSMLSLLSPLAVSPVYKSHQGPYTVMTSIRTGGSMGHFISPSLNILGDPVSLSVSAGRAMINSGMEQNYYSGNITFARFIHANAIDAIWSVTLPTVVARNSLDCGSAAVTRLTGSADNAVMLDDQVYFSPNLTNTRPSFAGQDLGYITNDPQITAVYLNSSVTTAPGVVAAETTVIFLAANGEMEGAQRVFTSPNTSVSRISHIAVLFCTSTTQLETSTCTIERGKIAVCTSYVPSNTSTGDVGYFVQNADSVATTLSASPVTAYYSLGDRPPTYQYINSAAIAQRQPPTSDLSADTTSPPYNIPLNYTSDVLFAKTAQGLVQGMVAYPQLSNPVFFMGSVELIVTFGTSRPELIYLTFVLCFACALIATISGTLLESARRAAPLDVSRILAISRNPDLDAVFEPYADRGIEIDEELMETRVGYDWVDELKGRVLVTDSQGYDSMSLEGHGIQKYSFER